MAAKAARYSQGTQFSPFTKKRNIYDFIFSGNVSAECTEETYALVKSWLPESVRMPKVKF